MKENVGEIDNRIKNLIVCLNEVFEEERAGSSIEQTVIRHGPALSIRLDALLDRLDAHQAAAFRAFYGLDNGSPKSLWEIAEQLGQTREQVRQWIAATAEYLKQIPNAVALFAYTEFAPVVDIAVLSRYDKDIEKTLLSFIEYEVRNASNPHGPGEDGRLVCNVDMSMYCKVYVVFGIDADDLSGYSYRSKLGHPTFMSVFSSKEAAVAYFRKKVLSIARNKALNERFFSHLTDEELFVDTYRLREYEDDEIAKLPVFIGYEEREDKLSWEFYKDDIDYDLIDPMPPRVYLRKRIVWQDEVEMQEDPYLD